MTHPTPESALRLAREALESCTPFDYSTGHFIPPGFDERLVNRALEALAAADAQAAEPAAVVVGTNHLDGRVRWGKPYSLGLPLDTKLYTHPAPPSAEPVEARPGWKLVPVEATKLMLVLGENAFHRASHGDFVATEGEIESLWSAMLAAAPTPDAAGEPQTKENINV